MSGCDSVKMASEMVDTASNIMSEGGFLLTKWVTNNSEVDKIIKIGSSEVSSVLGISYNVTKDCFCFQGYDLSILDVKLTKRIILSIVYKLFDPLGVLSPYIMYARFILQALWRLGIEWDKIPPNSLTIEFNKWLESSKFLDTFELTRTYFPDIGWDNIKSLQVHGFGDASIKGYGAVVYLRLHTQDDYEVTFGIAKAKVALVSGLTLPRLELLACLLNCRLVHFL